jgi:hypothetical protein
MQLKLSSAISLLLVVLAFQSSSLVAEDSSKQSATVPFDFVCEDTRLPAGTYQVELMDSGMLIMLNTKERGVAATAATLPLPQKDEVVTAELIFVKSAQGYRLLEIRVGQERRLMTSEYGHQHDPDREFRTVTIATTAEPSGATVRAVSQGQQ